MPTRELDEVTALLERILPDPAGFADRVLSQLLSRYSVTGKNVGPSYRTEDEPQEHVHREEVVIAPSYQPESWESLADSNVLLASALGACDCWGLQSNCVVCKGVGSSGWTQPDAELFQLFVGPAVERLSTTEQKSPGPRSTAPDQGSTRRGEDE
jgi:hypothetical protein